MRITKPGALAAAVAGVTSLTLTGLALSSFAVPSALAATTTSPPTKTTPVGTNPYQTAISQARGEAFVVNAGSVSVVNLRTHRQVAQIPTWNGHQQVAIDLGLNSTRAYVGAPDSPYLSVLDTRTLKVIARPLVGNGTVAIAKGNPSFGQRQYLAQLDESRIAIMRSSNNSIIEYVATPEDPQTVIAAPGNRDIWVGSAQSGSIWDMTMAKPHVRRTIHVTNGGPVVGIAFAKGGHTAWVTGLGGVAVVNVTTGKVVKFIPITTLFPGSQNLNTGPVALNASGTTAYVVNSTFPDAPGVGAVRPIDTRTYRLGAQITTGVEPLDVAIDHTTGTAYVANYGSNTLTYFASAR